MYSLISAIEAAAPISTAMLQAAQGLPSQQYNVIAASAAVLNASAAQALATYRPNVDSFRSMLANVHDASSALVSTGSSVNAYVPRVRTYCLEA